MNQEILAQVRDLIEEYRHRCLWFVNESFVPENAEQALQALDWIERYGDRSGFQKAQRLKKCLLQTTSAES